MTKEYQTKNAGACDALKPTVPERVSVVMADVAEDKREGLFALAVGAGLQVMGALMDAGVSALAGPRGGRDPERAAVCHGTGAGSVTLGGRRVPTQQPRPRAVDGSGELAVSAYELFSVTEIVGRMAMERMPSGLSTHRHWPVPCDRPTRSTNAIDQRDRPTRSTNAIESMISICREHATSVKHWHDGRMTLRWYAAGMIEASRQFRRVNGHLHVPALRAALERHVAEQGIGTDHQDERANAA